MQLALFSVLAAHDMAAGLSPGCRVELGGGRRDDEEWGLLGLLDRSCAR